LSPGTNLAILLPTLGTLLVAAGGFLLKRGRWPRRVGTTPHCSKCGYILSGLITVPDPIPRCPECGTPATPGRIRLGERPVRPAFAWAGGTLALLGALLLASLLAARIRHIQWIHFEPLGWLLRDLASRNASVSRTAWNEILRRDNAGLLSEKEKSLVVDTGIQKRIVLTKGWGYNEVATYAAQRYLDSELTDAQTHQLLDWITGVQLVVRPMVGEDSPLPYTVRATGAEPADWHFLMNVAQTRVDELPPARPGFNGGIDFYSEISGAIERHWTKPGLHRIRVKVKLFPAPPNFDNPYSVDLDNPPPGQTVFTRELSARYRVIEGQTPIAVITQPDASEIRRKIQAQTYQGDPYGPWIIHAVADPLPVDATFTVTVRSGAKEYRLEDWIVRKASDDDKVFYDLPYPLATGKLDGVELILRSDEIAARRTVDLKRIWKGQIVIPVPKRKDSTN
jgi:hypothetical protein